MQHCSEAVNEKWKDGIKNPSDNYMVHLVEKSKIPLPIKVEW